MLVDPVNVSSLVMKVVSLKLATYHELNTVYGLEDAMNLLEIHRVETYNNQIYGEAMNELRGK